MKSFNSEKKIDIAGLISVTNSHHTNLIIEKDNSELITYNIFNEKKLETLDLYHNNSNTWLVTKNYIQISSLGHISEEKEYIRSIFNRLDPIIDLDFKEMDHNNGSEIDIYSVNSSSTFTEKAVGQAIAQNSSSGAWWDIVWKNMDSKSNFSNFEKNTIIHEIGHALGLSHPFEDPDNKMWNSEDTIMSYNSSPKGWNTWFSEQDLNALRRIWGRENDEGYITFEGNSFDYKFISSNDKSYYIESEIGKEDITNIDELRFNNTFISVNDYIKKTFNLIQSKDHITGKIYRLYNSALGRFPDPDGLTYWTNEIINNDEIDLLTTAKSFILSSEYNRNYGVSNSDEAYIKSLYLNIFEREPDIEGYNYWISQLLNGVENRENILLGFSESNENKIIFTNETGII
tara:strand:- start:109 stop:1314 length:1206 start_codon:yes stop_codon:yes gene_type:complete